MLTSTSWSLPYEIGRLTHILGALISWLINMSLQRPLTQFFPHTLFLDYAPVVGFQHLKWRRQTFIFRAHSYSEHAETDGSLSALLDFCISAALRALALGPEQCASAASLTEKDKFLVSSRLKCKLCLTLAGRNEKNGFRRENTGI